MAVESTGTLLGSALPPWELPDAEGTPHQVREEGNRATLVAFVCNHCPYVQHVEERFGELASRFAEQGLRTIAVVSNNVADYPEDGVSGMAEQVQRAGWDFPYLIDSSQAFARELGAVCTPDFFLFDEDFSLTYRGAFDASSPKNGIPVSGDLLSGAIEKTLAGQEVPLPHRPAMGCGIKWIPGTEPQEN
jgi:thiol-disulfide isomerase/thioredoxin